MLKILFLDDFYYENETADVTFYLDINGQSFPDGQWTDFAIIILHWWISSILEIHKNENANFVLRFMDGPYYINCYKQGKNVHMACIEDKKRKTTICECDLEFNELVHELIDVSSKIIQSAERHDFGVLRGLDDLKKSLELLKIL